MPAAEGEVVRVRLRVTVTAERHCLVLDDPLPAVLEAVDLSLRTVSPFGAYVEQQLEPRDAARFVARLARWHAEAYDPLAQLYGEAVDVAALLDELLGQVLAAATARSEALRTLDDVREIDASLEAMATRVGGPSAAPAGACRRRAGTMSPRRPPTSI